VASSVDLLQQGIAAAKSGQKETARRLLTQVVEQDENNLTAWLWLSGVVERLDDKQVCLENVLTLDPNNQFAHKGLNQIQAQKGTSAARTPMTSMAAAPSRDEDRARTLPSAATSPDVEFWCAKPGAGR